MKTILLTDPKAKKTVLARSNILSQKACSRGRQFRPDLGNQLQKIVGLVPGGDVNTNEIFRLVVVWRGGVFVSIEFRHRPYL